MATDHSGDGPAPVAAAPGTWLYYCRPGYEPDLAAELTERAAMAGFGGYARARDGDGWLSFHAADPESAAGLDAALPWSLLVFVRQKLQTLAWLPELPRGDRIGPVRAALADRRQQYGRLLVEHPDSDAGRTLAGLARSFGNALRAALRADGWLAARERDDLPRLHLVLVDPDRAWLACSDPADSAPWPLGIPRLRLPRGAPSRSALKLEEALLTLLGNSERQRLLRAGGRAVDLGAAPGGWSHVLARHGLHVTAIDNGPLADSVRATGLVEHVRADGFSWRPPAPVDWMVCDMVEQPRRVAARVGDWLCAPWCRHAVFNLKLPMKRRWAEVRDDLAMLRGRVQDRGIDLQLRARQLYHDRDEITVVALTKP